MLHTYAELRLSGCIFLLLLILCGCTTTSSINNGSEPVIVTPKVEYGSSETSPIVGVTPTSVSRERTNSGQVVVLPDRTLALDNVSEQDTTDGHSTLISLELTVKNTSDKPILNQPTFFQLMGKGGDIFTYQFHSSNNFFGTLISKSTKKGIIVFKIPKGAASNLNLLYHSEVETETTLMPLKDSV